MTRSRGIRKLTPKTVKCRECGATVTITAYANKSVKCVECSIAAFEDAIRQLRAKSGPVWERHRSRVSGRSPRKGMGEG